MSHDMSRAEFEFAIARVSARAALRESEFTESFGGSWFIAIASEPTRRLVWDGKESWLVVEEETLELFNGYPKWKDPWTKRGATRRDLATAVERLLGGENDAT
jgi:hypothetical protein